MHSSAPDSQLLCDDAGVLLGAMHSGLVFSTLPSTEKGWGLARRPRRQLSMDCCCTGCRACTRPETFTTEFTHVRFSPVEKQQHTLSRGEPFCCRRDCPPAMRPPGPSGGTGTQLSLPGASNVGKGGALQTRQMERGTDLAGRAQRCHRSTPPPGSSTRPF